MFKCVSTMLGTLTICSAVLAQTVAGPAGPADTFQVGYAANLTLGDSYVNLTNASGGFEPAGNICANVYVFAEDQQLIACCACPLTPNHLKTFSVRNDLIFNPLTPGVPRAVTIGLVATTGGTCNPAFFGNSTFASGLRAWGTTPHQAPDGTVHVTEVPFLPATLSSSESGKLTTYCDFLQANGSGYGLCRACREGAQGAQRQ